MGFHTVLDVFICLSGWLVDIVTLYTERSPNDVPDSSSITGDHLKIYPATSLSELYPQTLR